MDLFTDLFSLKEPGEYPFLTMDEDPTGIGDGATLRRGRPLRERVRYEIPFRDLPQSCRQLVLRTYRELWRL